MAAPLGILSCTAPASVADPVLDRFTAFWGNVVGVTSATIRSYRHYVHPFVLGVYEGSTPDWTRMDAAYVVRSFLSTLSVRMRPDLELSLRAHVSALRGGRATGSSIAAPRYPANASVPRHLPAEDLERILAACQIKKNGSVRDRAFIAMLAHLGVRAGELRHLCLKDIDWVAEELHIQKSKSGSGRTLPVPADAGALLAHATYALG